MSTKGQRKQVDRPRWPAGIALALGLGMLQLGACADYKPYRAPDNSEIPDGPGLFTGSDGEWVLFRKQDKSGPEPTEEDTDEGAD